MSNLVDTNSPLHCFQFVIVVNLRVVGVPGQPFEPHCQETNIAQYFYFGNILFATLVSAVLVSLCIWSEAHTISDSKLINISFDLQSKRFRCALTSKLWSETSKLRMKQNFPDLRWKFLFTNFAICYVNQLITPNLRNKRNLKIKLSKKIRNFFKFQLGVSKFQFKVSFLTFEVYDQSFKVMGTHEPFWL